MTFFDKRFWHDTIERAVKDAAAAAAALLGVDSLGVIDLDFTQMGSVALSAAIASVLFSVASAPIGGPGASVLPGGYRGKHDQE